MYKVVHGLTDAIFDKIAEQGTPNQDNDCERTARSVSGSSEQTKTATHHHFYHVRFQNGIIFLTKLEMMHQLPTYLTLSLRRGVVATPPPLSDFPSYPFCVFAKIAIRSIYPPFVQIPMYL